MEMAPETCFESNFNACAHAPLHLADNKAKLFMIVDIISRTATENVSDSFNDV